MKQAGKKKPCNQSQAGGSLNRAVIILKAIAQAPHQGSLLTELAAKTSLPRATVHRVLDILKAVGWIQRDPKTARFNLGSDLAALGVTTISRNPIDYIGAQELNDLAQKLDQVIYLNVRSGLDVVCIGSYEGQSQMQLGPSRVGMRDPFGCSPSCLAMLSRLPKNEIKEIIRFNMSRYRGIEGFDEKRFQFILNETIKNGYSVCTSVIRNRITLLGFGVPICDSSGYPVAGISTTYVSGSANGEQLQQGLAQLKKAAANIQRRLSAEGY